MSSSTSSYRLTDLVFMAFHDRDFVYFGLVVASVIYSASVQKPIESFQLKKWSGTCFGVAIMSFVMGYHMWHFVVTIFIGAFLIVHVDKRYCHLVAFNYIFVYLTVFRIYIINEDRQIYVHINLVMMMMALKLTGVAFEINNSYKCHDKNYRRLYPDENEDDVDPKFSELLHYAFSYYGMLVGPYIRYRTYDDFLRLPFAKCSKPTIHFKKMLYVPIYIILYFIFEKIWPLEYSQTEEFSSRNILYILTFGAIQYQKFRFWMYTGLTMSECICTAAGFGAYPIQGKNTSAHGPTKNYKALKQISYETAKTLEYDFNTNTNIDVYVVQTSPWVSVYNRVWNQSVQYFMAAYIFKSLPRIYFIKPIRPFITIIISAYWHGIDIGYQTCMLWIPVQSATERLYMQICNNLNIWQTNLLKVIMYIVQYYMFGFAIMSFLLLDFSKIYRYSSLVYFSPYYFIICLYMLGLLTLSVRKLK